MTLTVPDEIARSAEEAARETGSSAETMLLDALRAHFAPLTSEFQRELEAWDRAADADAAELNAREGFD